MKKTLALFATVLAAVLNAATPSTSLVYVDTTARTLTGNIVAGNNTTISASGNGTITATAAPLTGITGLGTGVSTFLATPSSANLASAVTNETGSGALVFATSPTLVTPVLGAATGTSLSLTGAATSNNAFLVDTNTSFVSHTATAGKLQAQTSWGGVLSGFGTTNDVSIFNKNGGLALSVPTGSTSVSVAGNFIVGGGVVESAAATTLTLNATGGTMQFQTAGSTAVRLDSAGRVVIGGSALQGDKLEIQATDGSAASSAWRFSADGSSATHSFRKSRGTTVGTHGLVQDGDQLGQLLFIGSDGAAYRNGAQIVGQVDGTAASGSMPGRLQFYTTPSGSATMAERMRITQAGNVLLGTTDDTVGAGKLKLATHTSSAGGIGFGTDISLYRKGALVFGMAGVSDLFLESTGAGLWLGSGAGTYQVGLTRVTDGIVFKTGSNTTALTLNSSQNATLAGNLTVSGSGGTTTSDVTLGTSGPSVKSSLGARAPRQGLVYDGTTNSSATLAAAIGTSDFTVSVPFTVPASNPSTARGIFSIGNFSNSQAFCAYIGTNGALDIVLFGTTNADYRASGVLGFVSANAGKTGLLTITRSSTTLTVYFNGVSQTLVAPTILGTDPTWAGTLTSTSVRHGNMSTANYFYVGYVGNLDLYNRALSAAEVLALYESGAPAGADYNSATNTALNTNTFENSNIYAYGTFSGASATGFTAVSNGTGFQAAYAAKSITFKTGTKYRLTYTLTLNSGAAPFFVLGNPGVAGYSAAVQLSAGTNSVEVTATATGTSAQGFGFQHTSSAGNYSISNISLVPVGLLLAPDAQQVGGGSVWADTSGNAAHITLPGSGVSWNVPSQQGEYVSSTLAYGSAISLTSGTHANVTSISLTAGDWDVSGNVVFLPASTTVRARSISAINTTSADVPAIQLRGTVTYNDADANAEPYSVLAPPQRITVTSTTTVYLIGSGTFSGGAMNAFGYIQARRVR